jgi:hypothetical protein
MRRVMLLVVLGMGVPAIAEAQAPAVGPLLLIIPATPRTAALGNAWVAGRDQEVLFYNPAQLIGARQGMDFSITRHGSEGTTATLGSVYAGGKWSMTLGWGVQFADFNVSPTTPYPYSPDVLLESGTASSTGFLAAVGGAVTWKGFRFGAAGKYAADRVSVPTNTIDAAATPPISHGVIVADLGVARNSLGGVLAFSFQNLGGSSNGDGTGIMAPKQALAGWSMSRQAGPLDLALYTQWTIREDWQAAGAGVEVGYSWIEGYNVALRAGARRPESGPEQPFSLGAAFTADRLTIEYGVQFFEGGRAANGVTIRWR